MINFVFTTERYEEEAKLHSASQEIIKIRKKALDPGYQPNPLGQLPGNYYRIYYKNNLRIVLTSKDTDINGIPVRIYVALRILQKGGKDYEKFQYSMTSELERDTISGKISLVWDNYIKQATEELSKPISIKENPELSSGELYFILNPLQINHTLFDVTIFETKDWIRNVQKVDFTDFSNAAEEIEKYIYDNLTNRDGWHVVEFKENAILVFHHGSDWILTQIIRRSENGCYDFSFKNPAPVDFHRGYPYDYLRDKDEWRKMELDKKSNLVLSQQQVDIVSGETQQYPLFLTGRAGSGKSTLLQYIFAEVILRYLNTKRQFGETLKKPVYLSYSTNLIDDAIKLCTTLFEKTNSYRKELEKYQIRYKDDIAPFMDGFFFVFSDLLRNCIDKEEPGKANILFPKGGDKYISFPNFNSKWNLKFGRIREASQKYGPSISWHVIRTYIKGWNCNGYMTPDEYAKIGDKNQTVDIETFKNIYEDVWENWYSKLLSEGAWDDQDLVRYCLDNDIVEDLFSAIFCDESQDFTRVEIDFILKSSSFSNRKITNIDDIKKMPFVFAGDEFQTLNPTGFSWESLRSYFTERLCDLSGLSEKKNKLRIPDPIELSENFRSTREIVKLANRIQLLRASRFGEYSKPQLPHFSQNGNFVYCVSPTDRAAFEKLKEKQTVLIIPTNDGESLEEYIKNTPLRDQIAFENETPQGIIILNPTQAKGLEYPNVAIFGFNCRNQNSALSLDNLLSWFDGSNENSISDIGLKYQVSNAYVAVTRASSNLYIIDDFNQNSFWSFAFYHNDEMIEKKIRNLQNKMMGALSNSQRNNWTEDELGWIEYDPYIDPTDENLEYLRSEEHKYDLENKADSRRDAPLMKQAADVHRRAGNKKDFARCKAKAYLFEENYLQAAEWFEKAELFDDAINSYWAGLNLSKDSNIIRKISNLREYSHNIKVYLCSYCDKPTVRDFKLALNDVADTLKNDSEELASHDAWQFVINVILAKLKPIGKEGAKDIPVIISSCEVLEQLGISIDSYKLAKLVYCIGDFNNAILIWERMDKTARPQEYYQAKLKALNYPNTIEYYEGTGNVNWKESLIREYHNSPKCQLNDIQKRILSNIFRNLKGATEDYKTFLPFILRSATTIENSTDIINEAIVLGCKVNEKVLHALIETRYSNLQDWIKPSVSYIDPEASQLFELIDVIKRIRKEDFVDYLARSLKAMKVNDFCRDYKRFSRKACTKLLLIELGKVFEAKGRYIDSLNFYEWGKKQSDDNEIKRYMDIRWIACKERQAENDDNDNYRNDAQQKRRELHLSDEEKLPLAPSMSSIDWEMLFEYYMNVRDEVRIDVKTETQRINESPEMQVIDSAQKPSEETTIEKQIIQYRNYSIVYFPNKGDVVIKNDEEYSVRIRKGVFPQKSDFYLNGTRLFLSDNNSETPFEIDIQDKIVFLKIYEGKNYTGVSLSFVQS